LSKVLGGLLVTHHRLWWADWHCKAISALPYLFPILCLSSRSLNTGSKSHGCVLPPPIVSTPSLGSNHTTVPYGNKWRRRRCLHGTMSPSLLFTYCFQDIDLNCTSSSLAPHEVVSPVVCHCTALSSTTTKSELWAIHRQLRDFHLLRKKDFNMNSVCCFLFAKNRQFNPMHNRSKIDPNLIFCHLPFATLVACRVRTIWATQQSKQSYESLSGLVIPLGNAGLKSTSSLIPKKNLNISYLQAVQAVQAAEELFTYFLCVLVEDIWERILVQVRFSICLLKSFPQASEQELKSYGILCWCFVGQRDRESLDDFTDIY
jgi:hypothetical protein